MPTRTHMHKPRGGIRNRMLAVAAATFVACALALVPATGASAHDYLVDSTPKADSIQTTPLKQVTLTFDDVVLDLSGNGSSSIVQVTGPDAGTRHFETGCATTEGRVVTVPVALGGAGTYTVAWQIVSSDGHTVSQKIQFSYKPPAGTTEAAGSAQRPACGAGASGTSKATDAPASGTTANDGNLGIVVGIAGGIIGLAVIAVVVVLVTARRRPKDAEPWHPDEE